MKEKKLVNFPNEGYPIEMEIDMGEFNMVTEFEDLMFGWYNGMYISIKK